MKVFLLSLACLVSPVSAANEPAEAAMDYLEKVRLGTVNLDPGKDTALSPHTAPEKKREISERLSRLAGDLGKGKLEAGEVKVDDDLAAVLVRNTGNFDPSRMRVIAVALVKAKNGWIPAPAPASFDNSGIGFDSKLRQRIAALENWMLRTQATDLENIREKSVQKMKEDIRRALDPKVLASESPQEVRDQFLAACANRNLPAMLGFMGGLKDQYPPDWADRLRSADAAVSAGKRVTWPWRLLMAPEVVRVPVSDGGEQNEGLFSYACLDPAGQNGRPVPKVEILHLDFVRDEEGMWQVNLPPRFLLGPGEREDVSESQYDQQLLDAFPGGVRKETPEKPVEGIAGATAALQSALREKNLAPLFSLMNLSGDERTASGGCARAAQQWWLLHNPEIPRMAVPLGFHENGKVGIAAFQFFSPREPDRLDVRTFYFEKTESGWLLMPGLRPTNSPNDSEIEARDWADEAQVGWRRNWQSLLLGKTQKMESITAGNAPSEEEAGKLVDSWLAAIRSGNIEEALGMAVWMTHQGGETRLLQNLGYEIGSAGRDDGKASITRTKRGETWTAVGVKSESRDAVAFPLYLVVATPAGPRLLIETDLFADASSGRELLNKDALRRVGEFSAPGAVAELTALFEDFRSAAGKQ